MPSVASGLSGGGIAGIVIALLVIITAAVVGVVFFLRRYRRSEDMRSPSPTYSEEGNRGRYLTNHSTTMTMMRNQYVYDSYFYVV
jgi:hypothetical protein